MVAGVLAHLFEEVYPELESGFEFDVVSGTSVGAIHAAYVAASAHESAERRAGRLIETWESMRVRDMLRLSVGDLDLQNGYLRIRAKRAGEIGWQPKTRRNRVVPIAPALDSILKEVVASRSVDSWAFLSHQGCRWDGDNLYDRFKRVVKAAGYPKLTLLDLRHTFGTIHAMNGRSTWTIANCEERASSPGIRLAASSTAAGIRAL